MLIFEVIYLNEVFCPNLISQHYNTYRQHGDASWQRHLCYSVVVRHPYSHTYHYYRTSDSGWKRTCSDDIQNCDDTSTVAAAAVETLHDL